MGSSRPPSHACQYGRHWTPTTKAAQGLILEEATSRVVARPFEKFFNVGETPETAADKLPWGDPHELTEKMDGSLGIIYCHEGKFDIATRGAFDSPQAILGESRKEFALAIQDELAEAKVLAFAAASGKGAKRIHSIAIGLVAKALRDDVPLGPLTK